MGSPVSGRAFEFYEGLQADNSKASGRHKATGDLHRDPMTALVEELQPVLGGDVKVFRPTETSFCRRQIAVQDEHRAR